MARLFDRDFTREEILAKVGDVSQVAGVTKTLLADGVESGVESYLFRTGSGLAFSAIASRGMGIGSADWRGMPLAWMSPAGITHPAYYESQDAGFLRGFYSGLLTSCGLTNVGGSAEDGGKFYPMHGRISNTPAYEVSYGGEWQGDDYLMWVRGKLREAQVFGENLVLTRKISAKMGENRIWIDDSIENMGFEPSPLMTLYHFNAGFPVADAGSVLLTRSKSVTTRDADAEPGIDTYGIMDPPTLGYKEQVFYHDLEADSDGRVTAALVNKSVGDGFGLYLRYFKDELPIFVQWKQCGVGTYVMGMEPANCHVDGRVKEREQGTLQVIEPGQVRNFRLEVGVLTNRAQIEEIERRVGR